MSSLHSCHWDWCRFTTVLHDDFVQHVISAHIDKAEPIKRGDISLIHKVEQGASGHSGDVLSSAATTSQSEAPQSVSQPVGSTANYPVLSKPESTQIISHPLSFSSGSTYILPFSPRKQQTTASDSDEQSQGISQLELQTQAAYISQSF